MKRQVIALAIGSLFALPAVANNEIDAGYPPLPSVSSPGMTRDQVRNELVAAQRAGDVIVNAELGLTARQAAPAQHVGKTRDEVRAELVAAQRAGDVIVNAELGLTARQMFPTQYADKAHGQVRAELGIAADRN